MASDVAAVRHALGILDRHAFRTIDHAVQQFKDHHDRFRESLEELRSFRDTFMCGEFSAAYAAPPCSLAGIKESAKVDLDAKFGDRENVENQANVSYASRSRAGRKPKAAEAPLRVTRSRAKNALPKADHKEFSTEVGGRKHSSVAMEAVNRSVIKAGESRGAYEREVEILGITSASRQLAFPDVPTTRPKIKVSEATAVLSTGKRMPKKICREVGGGLLTSKEGDHRGRLQLRQVTPLDLPPKRTGELLESSLTQPFSAGIHDVSVFDAIHVKGPEGEILVEEDSVDLHEQAQTERCAVTHSGPSGIVGICSEWRANETLSEFPARSVSRCITQIADPALEVGGFLKLDDDEESPARADFTKLDDRVDTQEINDASLGGAEHEDLTGPQSGFRSVGVIPQVSVSENVTQDSEGGEGSPLALSGKRGRLFEDSVVGDIQDMHDIVGTELIKDVDRSSIDDFNAANTKRKSSFEIIACRDSASNLSRCENSICIDAIDAVLTESGATSTAMPKKRESTESDAEIFVPTEDSDQEAYTATADENVTNDALEGEHHTLVAESPTSMRSASRQSALFMATSTHSSFTNDNTQRKSDCREVDDAFRSARAACDFVESEEPGSITLADETDLGNHQLTLPNIFDTKPRLSGNEELPAYPVSEAARRSGVDSLMGSGGASCMDRIRTHIEDLEVLNLVVTETPQSSPCQMKAGNSFEHEFPEIMVHEAELCRELVATWASNVPLSISPNPKNVKEDLASRKIALSAELAACKLEGDPKDTDCLRGFEDPMANGVITNANKQHSESNQRQSVLSEEKGFLDDLKSAEDRPEIVQGRCLPISAELEAFKFVDDEELFSPHSSEKAFKFSDCGEYSTIPESLTTDLVADENAKCTPKDEPSGDAPKVDMLSARRTVNSSRRKRARPSSDFSLESMSFFKKIKLSVNDDDDYSGGTMMSSPEASFSNGHAVPQLPLENSISPDRFKGHCGSPIHGFLLGSHCNKVLGFGSTKKQENGGNKLYQSHSGVVGLGMEYADTPRFRHTASDAGDSSGMSRSQKSEMRLIAHAEEDEHETEDSVIPWSLSKPRADAEDENLPKVSKGLGYPNPIASAHKRYNLAVDVSSFLDIIHQKQAQASQPYPNGKREIRVKALEAAELAKRQEEKREHERKMRRMECLETKGNVPEQAIVAAAAGKGVNDKVKRAAELKMKMEQEKARKQEEEQRRKEEERKKKEAELADKKRKREDADKREREEKRKRVEEVQKLKREHEERQRLELDEKERQRRMLEERERRRKAQEEEAKRQKRREKEKEAERRRKQEEFSKTLKLAEKQAERKRKEALLLQPRACCGGGDDTRRKCSDLSSTESLCMTSSTDWELLQPTKSSSVLLLPPRNQAAEDGSNGLLSLSCTGSSLYSQAYAAGKMSASNIDVKASTCLAKLPTMDSNSNVGCQAFRDLSDVHQTLVQPPPVAAFSEGVVQSYEISPYKGSDDEEDEEDDDDDRPKKPVPWWARKENLLPQVIWQQCIDPDEIFSSEKTCSLAEIFGTEGSRRCKDFNQRGTSGDWLVDHATWKEEQEYKRTMGYLQN